jgi:hypothetical protein
VPIRADALGYKLPDPPTGFATWDAFDEAVERLLSIGATLVRRSEQWGGYCVVLRDPEGNEFCAD